MKTRPITIPKNDVLFDVDAVTHLFSRAKDTQDVRHSDAIGSDTEEVFDSKIITRFADRRAAELRDIVAKFLVSETSSSATAAISTEDSYVFNFTVEDAFQDELLASLANEVESYIATGATADWFFSVGDQAGNVHAQALPAKVNTIMSYLVSRKIPARV